MKYQGFKGLTKQEYQTTLLGNPTFQDGVQLAVIHKESDTLIGDLYLRQKSDAFWIGCSICRTMTCQGYAYEVVSAIITSLKNRCIAHSKADVECGNGASIALLKKRTFSYVGMDNNE